MKAKIERRAADCHIADVTNSPINRDSRQQLPGGHGFSRGFFGIETEIFELSVKRRPANLQPTRDFRHLAAIMADGEADSLGFDCFQGADLPFPVQQRQHALRMTGGGKAVPPCRNVGRKPGHLVGDW
jgi:hypothetical protein